MFWVAFICRMNKLLDVPPWPYYTSFCFIKSEKGKVKQAVRPTALVRKLLLSFRLYSQGNLTFSAPLRTTPWRVGRLAGGCITNGAPSTTPWEEAPVLILKINYVAYKMHTKWMDRVPIPGVQQMCPFSRLHCLYSLETCKSTEIYGHKK